MSRICKVHGKEREARRRRRPLISDPNQTNEHHHHYQAQDRKYALYRTLRQQRPALEAMFSPRSVAVIGATENPGSVGRTVLENLMAQPFGGVVHPVNPKRSHVLGVPAFKSVREIPGTVDLAVVTDPGRLGAGDHLRLRRRGCARHGCDFRRLQGSRRGRR